MLEDLVAPPIWLQENSVNISNLLRLSSQPIIRTEQKDIYNSTFPYALAPKTRQKSRDKCILFD